MHNSKNFKVHKDFKAWENAMEKSHPSPDIFHEITWWVLEPMTLKQWSDLDDAMCDAFASVGIEEGYMGVAGPIPFDIETEEDKKKLLLKLEDEKEKVEREAGQKVEKQ